MPKICYCKKKLQHRSLAIIHTANKIIEEYQEQGYDLTLRQLYYQFVARDLIPNEDSEYKKLGSIINDARLAGLIDWDAIIDRTRNVRRNSHWDSPADIIRSAYQNFRIDRWENQEYRVEVWIEKDALIGVIEGKCSELDVPCFSCRGYVSQSEMWAAAQRLKELQEFGYQPVVFHLGDHDPSGIDMTRDIQKRLNLLSDSAGIEVRRIALNMDQVEEYNPPPNPAKIKDSRSDYYIREFGEESWELDSLEPAILTNLVETHVSSLLNKDNWNKRITEEEDARQDLMKASLYWHDITKFLDKKK